jgi:serine/threonine-protein kinase
VALVSKLLLDPDLDVMNKAVDVIIQLNHPETAKYLIEALKSENEFSRRSAVEILNAVGTTHSVKYLLAAVSDEDWWVRSRASDALARIGGPRVVDAVLELIKDKDENIRRAAIEILNTCRDKRAVDKLIEATRDKDWWVSERAADALAEIGDAKALPALLEMMAKNNRSLPVAITAIGKLGNSSTLPKVLPYLQRPEKEVRVAAIGAVAQLAGEQQAEAVRGPLQQSAQGADETVQRAVSKALQKLEGRLSPSGRFTGTATFAGPAPTATGTPLPMPAPTARAQTRSAPPPPPSPAATSTARTLLVDGPEDAVAEPPAPEVPSFDLNALQNGDMIEGRYKFIQKIGKGAFGTVVLVEDTVVEERLILKFLNANVSSDEEMLKRFVHELRYSRRITHKNVIRIYDFLYVGGSYAISMEYFPSHTLGAEIANDKPMPPKKALAFATDICVGMSVAHQQGIIHRDLKPANILINDTGLLKIVDFGVAAAAKSGDTQLTKTGYVIGSPKYMAPEQILGKKVDERADIYSLGVILYEMLAGNPPYSRGDHMSVMYQHVQGKAQPLNEANPKVPREIADVVTKTMQVDKLKRYASMEELRVALETAAVAVR